MTTGGRTYINSITLDESGHVTALGTGTETVVNTNTATHADGIMDGSNSGTEVSYQPYTTDQSANAAPRLYTTTNVPTGTSRLNLAGYFWTTRIHSLGIYGGDLASGNLTIGSTSNATKGTITLDSNTVISGNLTINGTTTTINATTLTVDDKNIELGSVDSPTDVTANEGGITLKGTTDKTITWLNETDGWHFNQNLFPETDNTGVIGNASYT